MLKVVNSLLLQGLKAPYMMWQQGFLKMLQDCWMMVVLNGETIRSKGLPNLFAGGQAWLWVLYSSVRCHSWVPGAIQVLSRCREAGAAKVLTLVLDLAQEQVARSQKISKDHTLSNCLIFYSCCSIFLQACVQAISETVSHLGGKFSVLLLWKAWTFERLGRSCEQRWNSIVPWFSLCQHGGGGQEHAGRQSLSTLI